jgi:hypothetical protein
MTIPIFANSVGWNTNTPGIRTPRYAPLTCAPIPGRRGRHSSTSDAAAIR